MVDVQGALDNPDGESLTFGVKLMQCLQPFGWVPYQAASDLFSTLNFVALRTCFEGHLGSLAGSLELNQVAFFRVEMYLKHLIQGETVIPCDVAVRSYHFLDHLCFLDRMHHVVV